MSDAGNHPWGLIFDVDGVVANTEPIAIAATHAVFKNRTEQPIDDRAILQFMGSTASAYFTALVAQYAPGADVEALEDEHNRIVLREIRRSTDLTLPGVRSLFIRAGNDSSCRLAFATGSGRRRSEATIEACSLPVSTVRAWLTGDDIERPKPDPEIYLKTAHALELPPTRCVAIEDSIAGVASAVSAGMRCVAVTNTFRADELHAAHLVVDSLEDVTVASLHALL